MRRLLAAAAAVALVPVLAAPASAASERMTLDCGGTLGVIERTNGASWWGVDGDAVYTTEYLLITTDGETVHEKHYGTRAGGERSTCTADHVDTVWTVTLVQTR